MPATFRYAPIFPASTATTHLDVAEHISFRDVQFTGQVDQTLIVVTTDVPCHLFVRLTLEKPRIHSRSIERRGVALMSELRFCFVSFEDNEQAEPGDTLTHTWVKPNWGYCITKFCYFWGYVSDVVSPSTSPIFEYHNDFVQTTFNLTVSSGLHGSVTNPGIGVFTYDQYEVVPLLAAGDPYYQFDAWTGDTEDISDPGSYSTFIVMSADYAIQANFKFAKFSDVWCGCIGKGLGQHVPIFVQNS